MENTPPAIVVAISGQDAEPSLQYAVQEAVTRHLDVLLVHVLRMPASDRESFAIAHDAARAVGTEILAQALSRAEELASGRARISVELIDGDDSVASLILDRALGAAAVIFQHRYLGRLRRMSTVSTTWGAARRSHVPIVSVPESWQAPDSTHGAITVGVENAERAGALLRAGFGLAREGGAQLRVMHAWWYDDRLDDLVSPTVRDEWEMEARARLELHLGPLRAAFPEVDVEVMVRHAPAAVALVAAAESSDLIVVGRRDPALPFGSHLGSVARTVLRKSTCPVMVVESVRTHQPVA